MPKSPRTKGAKKMPKSPRTKGAKKMPSKMMHSEKEMDKMMGGKRLPTKKVKSTTKKKK
jgi:hypothetical protein